MYYISNCRYSDMKGIVYKYILFANHLLLFALVNFLQYVFDSNTCMVVPCGIIPKHGCITSAIIITQIRKVLHIIISLLPIVY